MSTIIMGQCWPLQTPAAQKAVLIALADQANDQGVCWPSVSTLSERTCLSERTVQRSISWLQAKGALCIGRSHGHSNVYTVTPAGFMTGPDLFDGEPKKPKKSCPQPRQRVTPHPRHSDTPPPSQ